MIIVVAKYSRTALSAIRQARFYGPNKIATPGNFGRIRGLSAKGLMIAGEVEISAEEGCFLENCFGMLFPNERGRIHEAIYSITKGGALAIRAHLDSLIAAEEARKKKV